MKAAPEQTIFRIFIFTLIFSPLAFGSVEPWSVLIMESGVLLALILLMSKTDDISFIINSPGILPLAGLLFFMLFQMVLLPPSLIEILSPSAYSLYGRTLWISEPGRWASLSLYPKGTLSEFFRVSSYASAYILSVRLLSDEKRLRSAVFSLALFASCLAFFSVIQHLTFNGKIYWIRELTLKGIPFGPYVNRNHFAGLIGMLFPFLMVLFLLSRPSSHEKQLRQKLSDLIDRSVKNVHMLWGFGAVVAALSIFLSLSRGGILSFCVSVALMSILLSKKIAGRKGRMLFFTTVVIIMYAVGWFGWTPIFERFRSVRTLQGEISELRLDIWKDSLGIIKDFPLTGTGAGSFEHIYPAYRTILAEGIADHAHNDFIEILTNVGIIGAGLLALFIILVVRSSHKTFLMRKNPHVRHIFAAALAGITSLLLHGMTDFNFFIGANGLFFFVLCGILVSASKAGHESDEIQGRIRLDKSKRKSITYIATSILILGILFTSGQMLGSMLRAEASQIYSWKLSGDAIRYLNDSATRASYFDPLDPLSHYMRGLAATRLSDDISAKQHYLEAVRLSPSNAGYIQALASATEITGNIPDAGRLYEESLRLAKTDTGAIMQYGSFLLRTGRKDAALSQFRRALGMEPHKSKDFTAFLVLEGLADDDILDTIPGEPGLLINFAEYLDVTGNKARALMAYDNARALLKNNKDKTGDVFWRISQFAAARSRVAEALSVMELASERFPLDINIMGAIASYHEKLGHPEKAAEIYLKILSLDPENSQAKRKLKELKAETLQQH